MGRQPDLDKFRSIATHTYNTEDIVSTKWCDRQHVPTYNIKSL